MVPVTVFGSARDDESGLARVAFKVTDEYGRIEPDGDVTINPDGTFSFVVALEPRRMGADRDGRRYTITVTATDNAGNRSSSLTAVVVLHDR